MKGHPTFFMLPNPVALEEYQPIEGRRLRHLKARSIHRGRNRSSDRRARRSTIFQVALLVRDTDRTRAEGADALALSMADAWIGHAVCAGCPNLLGVGL
jgi:hypothetical protein